MFLHFRDVLVGQAQAINARHRLGIVGAVAVLEFRDHALAAAGIAGDAIGGEREIRRDETGAHQRPHDGQKAGGPAAGIAHPLRRGDALIAVRLQFGEAEVPALRHPVGGGGVDHPGGGIVDQGDGFARRLVRQAQDHQIGRVQRRLARGRHPCARHPTGRSAKARPGRQALADLQTRGAGRAVDEDFRLLAHLAQTVRLTWT